MGKILAICTSPKRGTVKTEVPSAVLTPEWGIVSDAHGGSWHRQVSLLSAEKIEAFRQKLWVELLFIHLASSTILQSLPHIFSPTHL